MNTMVGLWGALTRTRPMIRRESMVIEISISALYLLKNLSSMRTYPASSTMKQS